MAHHWEDPLAAIVGPAARPNDGGLREKLRQLEAEQAALGATGRFPHGKLDAGDKGEIRFDVTAERSQGIARINFGQSITRVGLTLEQVEELIEALQKAAWELRGIESC